MKKGFEYVVCLLVTFLGSFGISFSGLAVLACLVSLSGCAGSSGFIPVYNEAISETGEVTKSVAGYTKEASVAKEASLHNLYKYKEWARMEQYKVSGFKMKFTMVEVAGVQLYLPKEISYKPQPEFDQKLPERVSEHPVWGTVNNVFGTVTRYGFFGYLSHEIGGVLGALVDGQGATFNGDANLDGSFNSVTGDYANTKSITEIPFLPEE